MLGETMSGLSCAAILLSALLGATQAMAQTPGPPQGNSATNPSALPAPASPATAPSTQPRRIQPRAIYPLADVRMRDVCIMPDEKSKTYYMVGPTGRGVRIYTSKDMISWDGPQTIYQPADDAWGDIPVIGIWAPEMHAYKGKYYLFLTFNTRTPLVEQWRNWVPRVHRGSTVLVSDSPMGPFKPLQNRSTPPADMMTLDGTLWVEDGKPHMVFCHEWVQVVNGTLEYFPLKDDLSAADGEPKKMFHASSAKWSRDDPEKGCNVTDGPSLYTSKSGKLFMIWSSFSETGYTTGVAISDSGKLAGPWRQEEKALYANDGGHGMLFKTFDGKLMMVLHSPNSPLAQPRVFELEDTGETLRLVSEFTGKTP